MQETKIWCLLREKDVEYPHYHIIKPSTKIIIMITHMHSEQVLKGYILRGRVGLLGNYPEA